MTLKNKKLKAFLEMLKKDYFINNYLTIYNNSDDTLYIFYRDKKLVVYTGEGFGYLLSWYCEGYINYPQAKAIQNIVNSLNLIDKDNL